ncbi:MAG: HAD-IA family hydrolase [Gammaproteobacteria bacterium]|jgi:HAD superfamily hydrolase (TIGR01509 family)|nr:HAD-IA family hydrolase [Gammaproteobacteria bacterium]
MPNIDLIIFDCDGVLVDSEPLAHTLLAQALRPYCVDAESLSAACTGRSYPDTQQFINARLDAALPPEFWDALQAETLKSLATDLLPDPKLRALLAGLQRPFCVASSGAHDKIRLSLRAANLLDLFEGQIFSAEDVAQGKPAPDVFLLAAKHNIVDPSQCLVIEDSGPGVAAGQAAGMTTLQYLPGVDGKQANQIQQLSELLQWL